MPGGLWLRHLFSQPSQNFSPQLLSDWPLNLCEIRRGRISPERVWRERGFDTRGTQSQWDHRTVSRPPFHIQTCSLFPFPSLRRPPHLCQFPGSVVVAYVISLIVPRAPWLGSSRNFPVGKILRGNFSRAHHLLEASNRFLKIRREKRQSPSGRIRNTIYIRRMKKKKRNSSL